jgi:arsenite-transporting ATPase
VPELSFFIGKGGVGKTTVSSSYAMSLARKHPRRRLLLLSTDPAHSLADLFQVRLGTQPKRLALPSGNLHLWQIDAERHFRRFLDKYRNAIFELLETGTIFTRDEIEPLLSTALPGMAEVSALLAISELLQSRRYDVLVVDTAPIGHTLRFFQMPEHFLRLLDFLEVAASRDRVLAAHFGGEALVQHQLLSNWGEIVGRVHGALSETSAKLVLVTTPESFALNESVRAAKALAEGEASALHITEIVLNRVVKQPSRACKACGTRAAAVRPALRFLEHNFGGVPVRIGEDHGSPVLGATDLFAFGQHVFSGRKLRLARSTPKRAGEWQFKATSWPSLETPLSLTLGKGGVGKTTISAGLAYHHRRAKSRDTVSICSTDPAPSLDDVFEAEIGNNVVPVLNDVKLRAIEVDSLAEFRHWAEQMRDNIDGAFSSEARGLHVDWSFERRLFSALLDIVPPGVDELFAVFKILDLLEARTQSSRVVIDMAPTGHALELLRMPDRMLLWSRLLLRALAPHRELPLAQDVAVEIARISQRVRSLAAMLKDGKRSRLWPVMLAEPLPDRQTERLLVEIAQLGGHSGPIFVNRVIFEEDAAGCTRCGIARRWQLATLNRLADRHVAFFVVPNMPREIAGDAALQSFTRELWQPK